MKVLWSHQSLVDSNKESYSKSTMQRRKIDFVSAWKPAIYASFGGQMIPGNFCNLNIESGPIFVSYFRYGFEVMTIYGSCTRYLR